MANQPGQKFLRILKWWPHWNGHVWCATFQQKLHWLSISLLKCREFFENHDAKCHGHTTDLFSELVATETFPKIYSTRDLVIFNVTCHRLLRWHVTVYYDAWSGLVATCNGIYAGTNCYTNGTPRFAGISRSHTSSFVLGQDLFAAIFYICCLHLPLTFWTQGRSTTGLGPLRTCTCQLWQGWHDWKVQAVVKQSWISMMDEFASWVENAWGQPSSFNSCTICLLARGH